MMTPSASNDPLDISENHLCEYLDLARERGMLLVQGPAGPAIVEDEDED